MTLLSEVKSRRRGLAVPVQNNFGRQMIRRPSTYFAGALKARGLQLPSEHKVDDCQDDNCDGHPNQQLVPTALGLGIACHGYYPSLAAARPGYPGPGALQ
jgi:hypothetical protein